MNRSSRRVRLSGQPLDNKCRCVLRQEECAPIGCLEIGQSLLMRRRKIRQARRSPVAQYSNWLNCAAFNLRKRGRCTNAEIVDSLGYQVLHRQRAATVWHMGDIDADSRVNQGATEMGGRARACRSKLHRLLVCFCVRNKFQQIVAGKSLRATITITSDSSATSTTGAKSTVEL
jgi:hypothetical protein